MTAIYFDNNASTPVCQAATQAMLDYLNDPAAIGNPTQAHWAGQGAKRYLDTARSQVASLINAATDEIVFSSGGTESNNHALYGCAFKALQSGSNKRHIISSVIEHPATLKPLQDLVELHGFEVSYVEVDAEGFFNLEDIQSLYREDTLLVSLMHANNELGSIQPIAEIGAWCRQQGVLFHVDAVCSAGKLDIDVETLQADLLSLSAHKFYGPKGVGALYIREAINAEVAHYIHGAGQQRQRRSGTENVILAVGMGVACQQLQENNQSLRRQQLAQLRDSLYTQLQQTLGEGLLLNGATETQRRLCNTLNVSFIGHNGQALLQAIGSQLAFTASKNSSKAVHLLGKGPEAALGAVRFSLGSTSTQQDVDRAVQILLSAIK
ncbi:cysteine desulfurase [Sinobacterium caligoides]|uniref:Cysteine desulfurase n=1 Tax=Sinobacterium caligoides TaxID=933926 RepID=A0A3N2DZT4_9GAMM|nr:cysteine desulfurase family protein [Sinobacterium caligoides]ROS05371.1 cysteine desulfurase [Sinobacterium caligoides]